MRNKEQLSVRSTVHSIEQPSEQSSVQPSVQPTVQSNGVYVYDIGIFVVLDIGVCVFFAYNTFQPKNKKNRQ